jgi:TonB family protein
MNSNRLLQITFTVSILAHGVILLQSPNLNPFTPAQEEQRIEVHYIKESLQLQRLPKDSFKPGMSEFFPKSEPFLKLDSKIISGNRVSPPPYVEPSNLLKDTKILTNKLQNNGLASPSQNRRPSGFSKPAFANSDLMGIKKKISLPVIEMAKIDNPSYISYYQIVREKIRRSAYQNYLHNETGEVYISFIISNDGYIKDVRLIEEKTSANDYLKNVALRSVRDASPFPNFPKELDYPQLSFNIIISFEIE